MEVNIQQAQDMVLLYGPRLLWAIVIFYVGRIVARLLARALAAALERAGTAPMLVNFSRNLAFAGMLAFVVLAALNQLGVQTTSFIAVVGAAGLAIGLALQGSLSNFAAGVMLVIFRPFKVGDFIEAGGTSGTVQEIDIFTTTLKTPDNKAVFVPNGQILGGTIVNYSRESTRRVDMRFGCGYGDDLLKAKALLEEIVTGDDRVLSDPAPMVRVIELGASSVDFVVRPWVQATDYWDVYFDVHEQVKLRFDEAGLSIPYPQQDVHVHGLEQAA